LQTAIDEKMDTDYSSQVGRGSKGYEKSNRFGLEFNRLQENVIRNGVERKKERAVDRG
jgi:hypothetical protein